MDRCEVVLQVMCCAASNVCFEIFGMDILFDHRCRAKILEVNTCPSLGCSPSCTVDRSVKYPMLAELLHLVGPVPTQVCVPSDVLHSLGAMLCATCTCIVRLLAGEQHS
jgi:hypothetical protein